MPESTGTTTDTTAPRWLPIALAAIAALLASCSAEYDDDTADDDTDDDDTSDDDTGDDDVADDDTADEIPTVTVASTGRGASARWAFEDAYDNVEGGDWYRTSDNESATLAWGESYVMMSLAAMFRATGDPEYLRRLAWHGDGVLAMRDDQRGVTDYRGVSGACWRNLHYQPNDEPYCYVVHSGMLTYPLAEFARLVMANGLEDELAEDGLPFGDKAAIYVAAAEATLAHHDDQWNPAGYYAFRSDATFLPYPGVDLPLNQSNAMGRALLVLYDLTGDAEYLDKATALAQRFDAQISVGPDGEYRWNYWGGAFSGDGEDISHAAINVDFAALCAERGVVFDAADLEGFTRTFMGPVYVDDRTLSDYVGGGATNGSSYRPQAGRWMRLTPTSTAVYTAVRDIYDLDYPAEGIGSGSTLASWSLLAEFEPVHCEHFFYYVDWDDPDPANTGDWRESTAYGANILTAPPDLTVGCAIPLEVDVPRTTDVEQWDGTEYHTTAVWQPTGGALARHVPYEPRWDYLYWNDGVLFQLADAFVEGDGIGVRESTGFALPEITSAPPQQAQVAQTFVYAAEGVGDSPWWWSLVQFPAGARIDPATGELLWTPDRLGQAVFVIELRNDRGADEQSFVVTVRP